MELQMSIKGNLSPSSPVEDVGDIVRKVQKEVLLLVDPKAETRRSALKRLEDLLVSPSSQKGGRLRDTSKSILHRVAEEIVTKPLLRRFADPSEKCRELAVSITLRLVEAVPEAELPLLPYMIPALAERLRTSQGAPSPSQPPPGEQQLWISGPFCEPAEEVRLLLVRLLHALVRHGARAVKPFASDIASMLLVAIADTNPDTLVEASCALSCFAGMMGQQLKPVARSIANDVMPLLKHRRHRVRLHALRAVRWLVNCGAGEVIMDLSAFRDPNLVPIRAFYHPDVQTQYLALLATDTSIAVREDFLAMIGDWLLHLPDRLDHENRLIPYVLSAFSDAHPPLRTAAFSLMEEIGLQYEKEREKDLEDTHTYLQEDIRNHMNSLPSPFPRRPCIGARILVRGCLSRLMPAIAAELQSWTDTSRIRTAHLLRTMLSYAEENVTQHLQPLLLALCHAAQDPLVAHPVKECCAIVGCFVDPSAYLPMLLPRISGDADLPFHLRSSVMAVLDAIVSGTPAQRLTCHAGDICSTLSAPDVAECLDANMKLHLVGVASRVADAWGPDSAHEALSLLWILLQAHATPMATPLLLTQVEHVMGVLACAEGHASADVMVACHAEEVMSLLPPPRVWHSRSLECGVLSRLLQSAPHMPPSALTKLVSFVDAALQPCVDRGVHLRILEGVALVGSHVGAVPVNDAKISTEREECQRENGNRNGNENKNENDENTTGQEYRCTDTRAHTFSQVESDHHSAENSMATPTNDRHLSQALGSNFQCLSGEMDRDKLSPMQEMEGADRRSDSGEEEGWGVEGEKIDDKKVGEGGEAQTLLLKMLMRRCVEMEWRVGSDSETEAESLLLLSMVRAMCALVKGPCNWSECELEVVRIIPRLVEMMGDVSNRKSCLDACHILSAIVHHTPPSIHECYKKEVVKAAEYYLDDSSKDFREEATKLLGSLVAT